jgi:hypothetical protein
MQKVNSEKVMKNIFPLLINFSFKNLKFKISKNQTFRTDSLNLLQIAAWRQKTAPGP